MASCEICGKSKAVGNRVSHANNRVKREIRPNIQRKKLVIGGTAKKVSICTRCLRSGNYR
ncbi:MAG: 50S ribosomal protein L28 [Nitrospiraceae bacterium]|nr:50S ribosomal protein L28 [Nitrospiraceae bacterium]MDA8326162.1 50S ribosomal protein L28 [Nitrospiraceae bacterium]